MNILAVLPTFEPLSGAHVTMREFLTHLVARDYRVEVITTNNRPKAPPMGERGVLVRSTGYQHALPLIQPPDLVITNHGDSRAARLASSRYRETPHLLMVHGMSETQRRLGRYTCAWFPSYACADHYPPARRVLISPPPINPDRYRTTPGDSVTLMASSVAKGADVLEQVATRLPDVPFLAVRSPAHHRPLDRLPNVRVIDRTDPREIYRQTRVLLMPSKREAYGRVGVEAMVSGIPIVAAPLPGIVEALGSGAFYTDKGIDDWTQIVETLMDDQKQWCYVSAWSLERAERNNYAADLAAFEELVKELTC